MRLFSHKLPIVLFSFEIHHHIEPKEGRNIYKIQITNSSNFKGWSKLTICFRFYDYILNLWLPPELEIVWVWNPPWVREVSVSRPVVLFILHHYDLIINFFPKKEKRIENFEDDGGEIIGGVWECRECCVIDIICVQIAIVIRVWAGPHCTIIYMFPTTLINGPFCSLRVNQSVRMYPFLPIFGTNLLRHCW